MRCRIPLNPRGGEKLIAGQRGTGKTGSGSIDHTSKRAGLKDGNQNAYSYGVQITGGEREVNEQIRPARIIHGENRPPRADAQRIIDKASENAKLTK